MADFNDAINFVLKHEGGTSNHTADPGGLTKFGISSKQYPQVSNVTFTLFDAKTIYQRDFWKYDKVTDQRVAAKIFDMAVNMGASKAHQQVQVVLNLNRDGVFGDDTLAKVNASDPETLLNELCIRSGVFYALIGVTKPAQAAFIPGWIRRAFDKP